VAIVVQGGNELGGTRLGDRFGMKHICRRKRSYSVGQRAVGSQPSKPFDADDGDGNVNGEIIREVQYM
jgi:hypothetical protein